MRFDVFFSTDLMSFVIMPIVVLFNVATEQMYKKNHIDIYNTVFMYSFCIWLINLFILI